MPREPPVTSATLPASARACVWLISVVLSVFSVVVGWSDGRSATIHEEGDAVTTLASSEARNSVALAMALDSPRRPIGMVDTILARASAVGFCTDAPAGPPWDRTPSRSAFDEVELVALG